MLPNEWLVIILAFVGLWTGAILAIKPIDEIAKKLNNSSFIVSFFVLGLFTSLTEISVAYNSYVENSIEISIGNLFGGSIVLLLFVIPLLGILANGIHLNSGLSVGQTFFCIIYLLIPHVFLMDRLLSINESIMLFVLYIFLAIYLFSRGKKTLSVDKKIQPKINGKKIISAFVLVFVGSIILIISSNIIVQGIGEIGTRTNLSPFILALIGLSIGTNLPEISLAIISAIKGRADIGFGNYLGSSLFNPFIMSILGIASGGLSINENFTKLLLFSFVGFLMFFFFIKSKHFLSRNESVVLIFVYISFIIVELSEM